MQTPFLLHVIVGFKVYTFHEHVTLISDVIFTPFLPKNGKSVQNAWLILNFTSMAKSYDQRVLGQAY